MATRVFTDRELAKLRSFPEITPNELIRFFTLTPADIEFIDPGRGRGPADRIGLAVQLCTLPWLGFVPDDVTTAPTAAVARLSDTSGRHNGDLHSSDRVEPGVTAMPHQDAAGPDHAAGPEVPDAPIFQSLARSWSVDGRLVPGVNDQGGTPRDCT